ncbi:MAG: helix-turn-helix transcriptional regulator [Candidatus Paceibacterota bacterium]|jgi:predicted transcriptional regulator
MRKDKQTAYDLREKGLSYNEISSSLGISKSTLSGWFSGEQRFSRVLEDNKEKSRKESLVRMKILNHVRHNNLADKYKKAENEAVLEFEEHKDNPLFLVALALYWGEGDKKSKYNIRISNVEPELVRIFVLFSQQILKINKAKIKIGLLLYPDLDDNICKRYWRESLDLEESNFYKTIVIQGRHQINRLSYGVCSLGFSSAELKKKMLVWIKLLGLRFEDKI